MVKPSSKPVSRVFLATGFCLMLFLAATLSYYNSPPPNSTLTVPMQGDRDEEASADAYFNTSPDLPTAERDGEDEPKHALFTGSSESVQGENAVSNDEVMRDENDSSLSPKDMTTTEVMDTDSNECATSRRREKIGFVGNNPRFQYVHIPKTGGTSVQITIRVWEWQDPARMVLVKSDDAGFKSNSFACPSGAIEASLLMGHRGYGYCREVENSSKGLFTFATFRNSASRIVSLFDYNLNREEARTVRLFGTTPLNTWIKKFNSTPEVEEGEALLKFHGSQQIRFMCGYECMGPNAWGNATLNVAYMKQRAVENLRKLDAIGLLEELDDAILQLKFHLPFIRKKFTKWPQANEVARQKKSELDEESIAILEEWARPDQELYDIARKVYTIKQAIAEKCLKSNPA